jgi:hypothetical protein
MNFTKTCKLCKQQKSYVYSGLNKQGKLVYRDSSNCLWVGHTCPDCHRDIQRNRQKAKRIPKKKEERICSVCGSKFLKTNAQRFCSTACRNSTYTRRYHYKRAPNAPIMISCAACGAAIRKTSGNTKFCSKECKRKKICKNCGQQFIPKKHQQVCCEKVTIRKTRECITCGKSTYNPKYCAKKCRPIKKKRKKQITPEVREQLKKYKKVSRKKRRLKERKQTPKWANKAQIRHIYETCPTTHDVDHIIPLNHQDVCGLHVEHNLQHLPKEENHTKSNTFDGTYENSSWRKKT